ncbi:MAG: hypothetical protein HY204_00630 [Nitrospirae bacterium]|nr:hypothetical protein [Nitrospirota bacterium]
MPSETRPRSNGYRYPITDEAILKYMQWSIATRLTWLEEANRFLFAALSPKSREVREAFRRGTL